MEGYLPELFKGADVRPLPKQMPPMSIENGIRPVSLTCQLAKVMEGFTLSRISHPIINNLDPKQFAVAGKSTSHALAYILHIILESLDKGGCLARLFFADFRKGFDLIDHQILLRKLAQFDRHNCFYGGLHVSSRVGLSLLLSCLLPCLLWFRMEEFSKGRRLARYFLQ